MTEKEQKIDLAIEHVETYAERREQLLKFQKETMERFASLENNLKEYMLRMVIEEVRQAKLHDKPSKETEEKFARMEEQIAELKRFNGRMFLAGVIFGLIAFALYSGL